MAKSSINIQPVKSGSERHNTRKQELDYVNKDLSHLNYSETKIDISTQRKFYEHLAKEKTGRCMQKKATPIREAVFLFEEKHTNDDLYRLSRNLCDKFKLDFLQLHVHRDEGHREKHTGGWIPNYHAHLVVGWMDKNTGKSLKLNRDDMSKMQDFVAEQLKMERGAKGSKTTRLDAYDYKIAEKEKQIQKLVTQEESFKILFDLAANNPTVKGELQKAIKKAAIKPKIRQPHHPPKRR